MATRLTDVGLLTAAPAGDDLLYMVDTSDITDNAAGSSKRLTLQVLANAIDALIASAQNNFSAVADPTVTDDSNAGYSVGSRWINTNTDDAFDCVDSTVGAAIWVKTTLTAVDLAAVATTGSYTSLVNSPFYVGTVEPATDKIWFHTDDLCTYMYSSPLSRWIGDSSTAVYYYHGLITAGNKIPVLAGHFTGLVATHESVVTSVSINRQNAGTGSVGVYADDVLVATAVLTGSAVEDIDVTPVGVVGKGAKLEVKLETGSQDLEDPAIRITLKRTV